MELPSSSKTSHELASDKRSPAPMAVIDLTELWPAHTTLSPDQIIQNFDQPYAGLSLSKQPAWEHQAQVSGLILLSNRCRVAAIQDPEPYMYRMCPPQRRKNLSAL